jgi:hypothetical protein
LCTSVEMSIWARSSLDAIQSKNGDEHGAAIRGSQGQGGFRGRVAGERGSGKLNQEAQVRAQPFGRNWRRRAESSKHIAFCFHLRFFFL